MCLPERLLRQSSCCHVLNGADVLQPAILIPRPVSNHVQVLDRLVRHLQPELIFKVAAGASCPLDHVMQQRDVFRVDSSADQLERHGHTLVKLENAIELC